MDPIQRSVLFLIVLLSRVRVQGQEIFATCIDRSHADNVAKLDCGSRGKIVYIDYEAGDGFCAGKKRCYGKTPDLLIEMHVCYWQTGCNVSLPSDLIIKPEYGIKATTDDRFACIGSQPTFLNIESYKCFDQSTSGHRDSLRYIRCRTADQDKAVNDESGILVSHALYPWDYTHEQMVDCSLELSSRDNMTLRFTVLSMDISDVDTFSVEGRAEQVYALGQTKDDAVTTRQGTNTRVAFHFSTLPFTTGGKGFVICYKFYSATHILPEKSDVCDDITEKGAISTGASRKPAPGPVVECNKRCTKKRRRCVKKKTRTWDPVKQKCRKNKKEKKSRKKKRQTRKL